MKNVLKEKKTTKIPTTQQKIGKYLSQLLAQEEIWVNGWWKHEKILNRSTTQEVYIKT